MKLRILSLLLFVTFFSCEKEEENIFDSQILPSGIWQERFMVLKNNIWSAPPGSIPIKYQFNRDHTGTRTVISPFSGLPTGQPIGGFYGNPPLPSGPASGNIDPNNLSFHWTYSSDENALVLTFTEINFTRKIIIHNYYQDRFNTKPVNGKIELPAPTAAGEIVQQYEGYMTMFEKKK